MKKCSKCKNEKELKFFSKNQTTCKECSKIASRKWYAAQSKKNATEYWSIYYLPEEHYCGVTINLFNRMKNHAKKYNIAGWRVLATKPTKVEAIVLETEFHLLGMNGHQAMSHVKQFYSK